MNISRRQFLKILGATCAVVAVDPTALAAPKKSKFKLTLGYVDPGEYWFSYYHKSANGEWMRYAEHLIVEEQMAVQTFVDLETGDYICNLQLEHAGRSPTMNCLPSSDPVSLLISGEYETAFDSEMFTTVAKAT